jgi:membrane associated rhomboid family serine protease
MFINLPPVTQRLIIANVIVFVLTMALGNSVVMPFALWPIGPQFAPWQIATYAFLHGSVMHLLLNMFALGMFGSDLERVWGPRRYLIYYSVSVLAAALMQLLVGLLSGANYPTIGASGGVFGLLLAFALYFPRRTVMLILPPIPMPAWLFATLYGVLELFLGVTGTEAGVAHFAHLGGMLGGYVLILIWRTHRGPFAGR